MSDHPAEKPALIAPWQRGLMVAAAIAPTLLIAMGGVLCVTHFIRTCPDWPGCFGRIVPPAETGPILEFTHRYLAAISGLLILGTALVNLVRVPRLRWLVIPPWIAVLLLVEVSYFGAQVVLRGLAPGWAAVDVGSALLVVALMVVTMVMALSYQKHSGETRKLSFRTSLGWLALASTIVVYIVLLSGVLVAGSNSITGCLGWPVYSLKLFQADLHIVVKTGRLLLSIVGIALVLAVLAQALRKRLEHPGVYSIARWAGILFLVEAILQVLLLLFNAPLALLIGYTVTMAVFWAVWVGLLITIGLEARAR